VIIIVPETWYQGGLAFTCTRCGKCCTGEPGFVAVNDEEVRAIAEFRHQPEEEVRGLFTRVFRRGRSLREKLNGDCVFYDAKEGCTIYAVRPRQCRTWPFWHSNVVTSEAWERTKQVCPGAGTGELISVEEITRRVKVIKL
jgi:Fe-S-cluster containining protein